LTNIDSGVCPKKEQVNINTVKELIRRIKNSKPDWQILTVGSAPKKEQENINTVKELIRRIKNSKRD